MRPTTLAILLSVLLAGGLAAGETTIGAVAPEFGGTTFFNAPAGATVTLAGLRGKVVLLDFWATWCKPCVEAIPHATALYRKFHARGLEVIGHTDASSEDLPAFIAAKEIPYVISVGPDIGSAYGVSELPHAYLIGPDGRVVWHGPPAELDEETVANALTQVKP